MVDITLTLCRFNVSPFEYALGESGGSLQLAIVNGQLKWPAGPSPPYPDELRQFVICFSLNLRCALTLAM
jgi:serine/threonine kinase 16